MKTRALFAVIFLFCAHSAIAQVGGTHGGRGGAGFVATDAAPGGPGPKAADADLCKEANPTGRVCKTFLATDNDKSIKCSGRTFKTVGWAELFPENRDKIGDPCNGNGTWGYCDNSYSLICMQGYFYITVCGICEKDGKVVAPGKATTAKEIAESLMP
jgi:hypothetical protein